MAAKFIFSPTFRLAIFCFFLLAIFNANAGRRGKNSKKQGLAIENLEFIPHDPEPSNVDIHKTDIETIFINKDSSSVIKATKSFILDREIKIQYFEVLLNAKGSHGPIRIQLKGKSIKYEYKPEVLKAGDRIGCGIVHSKNGKFYCFYTVKKENNNELIIGNNFDVTDPRLEDGLIPTIELLGKDTQISIPKMSSNAPSINELEQKIAQSTGAPLSKRQYLHKKLKRCFGACFLA